MITAVCCNLIGNRLLHIFYICIECTPSKSTDIQLIADELKLQIPNKCFIHSPAVEQQEIIVF